MSEVTKDQVVDFISNMTVLELSDFIKELEEKFGVSAAAAPAMMAPMPGMMPAAGGDAGGEAAAEEEKTEFDVILKAPGGNKIAVIKAVRAITGLGLKEAKALVDEAPKPIKEAAPKEEAEEALKQLEEAGAEVEMK